MLDQFNRLPAERAEQELMTVCAAPAWASAVAAGRPYEDLGALRERSTAAFARLTWPELAEALAAHPRIGQPAAGSDRESAWSRREQSGVRGAAAELAEANRAYEDRFGFLFLIFATGRSAEEILAAARQRLTHDDETERHVVQEELAKIVDLRLERLVADR